MKTWAAGDKVLAADLNGNFTEVQRNVGSGTSGEAYAVRDALYLKAADGRLYKSITTGDESTYSFVGFAIDAATGAGQAGKTYARVGGVVSGFSGLTKGAYYYISGTAGAISSTPDATRSARVAQAIETDTIRVCEPKFIRKGSVTISATGDNVVTTGFYPARVRLMTAHSSNGISIGDDGNRCVYESHGNTTQSSFGTASYAWYLNRDSTNYGYGTVSAKSQTGFTLNAGNAGVSVTIYWEAEN